jgi:hypothetical protein
MFLTTLYEVAAFKLQKYTKTSTLLSALDSSSYTFDEIEALGFKSGIFLKSTITGPTLKLEAYVKSDLDYKIGYLTNINLRFNMINKLRNNYLICCQAY